MTLRELLSPAALALLAACAADPTGHPDAVHATPTARFDIESGQLGSGNATDAESNGQLGSGNATEEAARLPQIGSGAVHDNPLLGSGGGLAPEDAAASTSAGPAFGSGVGVVQPPTDAPMDSIGG
ncbi:MAG TPA: hypothetical protein VFR81_03105 [Longimicrobium sp.]|nr:hypothetical protein [Longimicrobium sp.]